MAPRPSIFTKQVSILEVTPASYVQYLGCVLAQRICAIDNQCSVVYNRQAVRTGVLGLQTKKHKIKSPRSKGRASDRGTALREGTAYRTLGVPRNSAIFQEASSCGASISDITAWTSHQRSAIFLVRYFPFLSSNITDCVCVFRVFVGGGGGHHLNY